MSIDAKKKAVFEGIYDSNHWGDALSKSGPGSNFSQTEVLRKVLPGFLKNHRIESVLDIPCGDFFWMSTIQEDLGQVLQRYIGGDIVNEAVVSNNAKFANSKFTFQLLDLTVSQLPKVDLIFCRDCLVHFSYQDIFLALKNIKRSGSTFLLTTSFTKEDRSNVNMNTGGWRPLNFRKFPFFFPQPVDLIEEKCSENGGIYSDKSVLLWRINGISLFYLGVILAGARLRNAIRKLF